MNLLCGWRGVSVCVYEIQTKCLAELRQVCRETSCVQIVS